MAYKNKIINNQHTGIHLRFLNTAKDTKGEFLEMEAIYQAASQEPPVHYHPYQSENFTVLAGEMRVRLNNQLFTLQKGETLSINPNEPHSMWNNSTSEAIVNWKVTPAMNTENFLETINGLISDKKIKTKGGNILQLSLTANKFSSVFRLTKPSYIAQKILFSLLSPVAWFTGHKAVYKKYID